MMGDSIHLSPEYEGPSGGGMLRRYESDEDID